MSSLCCGVIKPNKRPNNLIKNVTLFLRAHILLRYQLIAVFSAANTLVVPTITLNSIKRPPLIGRWKHLHSPAILPIIDQREPYDEQVKTPIKMDHRVDRVDSDFRSMWYRMEYYDSKPQTDYWYSVITRFMHLRHLIYAYLLLDLIKTREIVKETT